MSLSERASLISKIPLFRSLKPAELEHLSRLLKRREYSPGEVLMKEGESDDHFYILVDGEVEVIKALGSQDERQLAIIAGGSVLGEMSLFSQQGFHTASVRARSAVSVMEVTRQDFNDLLQREPTLVYDLLQLMSQRLEESENMTILDLSEKNRQLTQAYQELEAAQAQLIIQERLERELAIARQIQESILPEKLPQMNGFDIGALTIPARAVGGDYYDFFQFGKGHIGLVLGDACDKGIPAALFINLTHSLVSIEARRNPTPAATLRRVNEHLLEKKRSRMFATLFFGVLDTGGQLDYCRAGHPYPLVLDQDFSPVETQPNPGMPLGVIEEVQLDSQMVIIPTGGLAVIYSDGLSEALNSQNQQFGSERLAEDLLAVRHLPAQEICQKIWENVQIFMGDQPQSDDFTVVVIKRVG